jgi:serine/threonine protein kinase
MGAVYLAHDQKLNRRLALKVPRFRHDESPDLVKRFVREARVAAGFNHPNLCPVFDVGEVDGVHYLTMPFVEGKPLTSLLAAGPLEPRKAAKVVRTLALAVAEAHRRGVIHRDLKPSNVMVSRRGELIVMDFGLARLTDRSDSLQTGAGEVLGTPAYMAPEQVDGTVEAIGPATDVYSLGVIAFQLLTGKLPFEGSIHWVFSQIVHEPPPAPSSRRPGLDPDLDAICLKALAKQPGERYASAAAMASALEAYLKRTRSVFPAGGQAPAPAADSGQVSRPQPPTSPGGASSDSGWSGVAAAGATPRPRLGGRSPLPRKGSRVWPLLKRLAANPGFLMVFRTLVFLLVGVATIVFFYFVVQFSGAGHHREPRGKPTPRAAPGAADHGTKAGGPSGEPGARPSP